MNSKFSAYVLIAASVISPMAIAGNAVTVAQALISKTPKVIKQATDDLDLAIRTGDVTGFRNHVISPIEAAEKSFDNGNKCDAAYGQNDAKYNSCYSCEVSLRYFRDYAETFTRQENVDTLKFRKNREDSYKKELAQCKAAKQ